MSVWYDLLLYYIRLCHINKTRLITSITWIKNLGALVANYIHADIRISSGCRFIKQHLTKYLPKSKKNKEIWANWVMFPGIVLYKYLRDICKKLHKRLNIILELKLSKPRSLSNQFINVSLIPLTITRTAF